MYQADARDELRTVERALGNSVKTVFPFLAASLLPVHQPNVSQPYGPQSAISALTTSYPNLSTPGKSQVSMSHWTSSQQVIPSTPVERAIINSAESHSSVDVQQLVPQTSLLPPATSEYDKNHP